jgi:hypothetical protein
MHWLDLDGAMEMEVVGQASTGGGVDVLWYADQIRSGRACVCWFARVNDSQSQRADLAAPGSCMLAMCKPLRFPFLFLQDRRQQLRLWIVLWRLYYSIQLN